MPKPTKPPAPTLQNSKAVARASFNQSLINAAICIGAALALFLLLFIVGCINYTGGYHQ